MFITNKRISALCAETSKIMQKCYYFAGRCEGTILNTGSLKECAYCGGNIKGCSLLGCGVCSLTDISTITCLRT
jgi:hypothetical protein